MKFITILFIVSLPFSFQSQIEWLKCYGGWNQEYSSKLIQTSDGGYIFVGRGSTIPNSHGQLDVWVTKISNTGVKIWEKAFGGASDDGATSIIETSDNCFVVGGWTASVNTGNVSGFFGGAQDGWIIKLSSNGDLLWQKVIGGSSDGDVISGIIETNNGNIIAVGKTNSINGNSIENHGADDGLVVELNSNGNILWTKCYGGSSSDFFCEIVKLNDGNFLLSGGTNSNNGNVINNKGQDDFWIIKINESGTIISQQCIGGSNNEKISVVKKLNDGNIILFGQTMSNDGDIICSNYDSKKILIVKLDYFGSQIALNCVSFLPFAPSLPSSVIETSNGYVFVGSTKYSDIGEYGIKGEKDCYIAKTNFTGDLLQSIILGGTYTDEALDINLTSDGGYIVTGYAESNDQDFIMNNGTYDYSPDGWVLKLNNQLSLTELNFQLKVFPNPTSSLLNVLTDKALYNEDFEVFDLQGNKVFLEDIKIDAINVELLNNGTYILKIGEIITTFVKF